MFLLTIYERAKGGKDEKKRGLCFFLGFYLQYMGISFLQTSVARLVGWRVNLRVNFHYPGMEFPIAVVAREIAALWRLEGQWQILMGVYGCLAFEMDA